MSFSIELLLDLLSAIALASGSLMCLTGALGLLRLPDFFCRLHATSLTDTLGAPLILIGLMLQTGFSLETLKLLLVMLFLLLTSPTATHALSRSALLAGLTPKTQHPSGSDSSSS